jgi:putative FmdB family regulatory protein
MPTYEYRCEKCSHQFEAVQKITEEPLKRCPNCRGKLTRLLFAAGIIFKGDGFYVTEQRKLKEKKEKVSSPDKSPSANVSSDKATETPSAAPDNSPAKAPAKTP